MPSSAITHRIDIPERLWRQLDAVAERANVPTSQLAGSWLYEELLRRSRDPKDHAAGLALEDNPYRMGVRPYPRRERATNG